MFLSHSGFMASQKSSKNNNNNNVMKKRKKKRKKKRLLLKLLPGTRFMEQLIPGPMLAFS